MSDLRWQAYVSGTRGTLSDLMQGAVLAGVKLRVDVHDKGWIRESVMFTVTGSERRVNVFKEAVRAAYDSGHEYVA